MSTSVCSFYLYQYKGAGRISEVDPPWGGPIELFLVPASAPRLV